MIGKTLCTLLAAVAWLAPAVPAGAQPPAAPPSAAAPDDGQVSELVVVAHPLGPALWRVQVGTSTMMILGSVTPMHQQQPDLGPLQLISLITTNIWKVRQNEPVESLMPPDLRARFDAARARAGYQKVERYAHWKPAVAGFLLQSDYRRAFGFSEGKPGTTVEKMARQMHVATQPDEGRRQAGREGEPAVLDGCSGRHGV